MVMASSTFGNNDYHWINFMESRYPDECARYWIPWDVNEFNGWTVSTIGSSVQPSIIVLHFGVFFFHFFLVLAFPFKQVLKNTLKIQIKKSTKGFVFSLYQHTNRYKEKKKSIYYFDFSRLKHFVVKNILMSCTLIINKNVMQIVCNIKTYQW